MTEPVQWSPDEIRADTAMAIEVFRRERFAEPLEAWLREVDDRREQFRELFDEHEVRRPHKLTPADVPKIIKAGLLDALRYLPGPPISADDLKNLADVESLAPSKLRAEVEGCARLLDTIGSTVDPRRFPWLAENRDPTVPENQQQSLPRH